MPCHIGEGDAARRRCPQRHRAHAVSRSEQCRQGCRVDTDAFRSYRLTKDNPNLFTNFSIPPPLLLRSSPFLWGVFSYFLGCVFVSCWHCSLCSGNHPTLPTMDPPSCLHSQHTYRMHYACDAVVAGPRHFICAFYCHRKILCVHKMRINLFHNQRSPFLFFLTTFSHTYLGMSPFFFQGDLTRVWYVNLVGVLFFPISPPTKMFLVKSSRCYGDVFFF